MLPTKKINVREIATKSKLPDADYVINPYVGCPHKCIYCYAEFMKRFTNHREEWGKFLDIKQCGKPIDTKMLSGKSVLISSVTDAYNPYEAKYKATQSVLNQLADTDVKVEILTKSKLILRDLDILKKLRFLRVGISLNTLDDTFRRYTEPLASPIKDRLEALSILKSEGIKTYLFVSPIFPGITKVEEIIDKVGAGVDMMCFENLNLRAGYKERVLKFINGYSPDLYPLYNEIFCRNNKSYWEDLRLFIEDKCTQNKIPYKIYFYHEKIKKQ
jgi:DNA repair photolyase